MTNFMLSRSKRVKKKKKIKMTTAFQHKCDKITCVGMQHERVDHLQARGVEGLCMKGGKMDQNN